MAQLMRASNVRQNKLHLNSIDPPWYLAKNRQQVIKNETELRSFSPRANYTDRATTGCRLSYCQILQIEGVAWSAQRIPTAKFSALSLSLIVGRSVGIVRSRTQTMECSFV
jgi:hypothetical protein